MNLLRIVAVGDGRVPYVDETGRAHLGRFFGRDRLGAPLPEPELVADGPEVRKALHRGSLALAPEPAPAAVAVAPAEAPEPAPAAAPGKEG